MRAQKKCLNFLESGFATDTSANIGNNCGPDGCLAGADGGIVADDLDHHTTL